MTVNISFIKLKGNVTDNYELTLKADFNIIQIKKGLP